MSKKILLIITGSIAAYKAMDLVRLLKKKDFDVTCVLTKAACEFITSLLASSLSQNKSYTELFSTDDELEMGHIKLARAADLIVVAPTSADLIAKMANGYADDLASSIILAADKKIMIAPAMNEKMWFNEATQKNLTKLTEIGISMVEPKTDILACGEFGIGKMSEPQEILEQIEDFFAKQNLLKGKKILLTAGATYEPIDNVRFIGNRSSGKQAIAIAKVLSEMGADVTMVAANIFKTIPLTQNQIIRVNTAQEMLDAVKNNLAEKHVFIGCAAVADFCVKNPSSKKIKKSGEQNLTLELVQTPDILGFVGNSAKNIRPKMVIGFAAEDKENIASYAKTKLQKKGCNLIIANEINSGKIFGSDVSKAYFVDQNEVTDLGNITKTNLAQLLASKIVNSN